MYKVQRFSQNVRNKLQTRNVRKKIISIQKEVTRNPKKLLKIQRHYIPWIKITDRYIKNKNLAIN